MVKWSLAVLAALTVGVGAMLPAAADEADKGLVFKLRNALADHEIVAIKVSPAGGTTPRELLEGDEPLAEDDTALIDFYSDDECDFDLTVQVEGFDEPFEFKKVPLCKLKNIAFTFKDADHVIFIKD